MILKEKNLRKGRFFGLEGPFWWQKDGFKTLTFEFSWAMCSLECVFRHKKGHSKPRKRPFLASQITNQGVTNPNQGVSQLDLKSRGQPA